MSRVIRNNDDRITLSSLVSVYKKAVKSTRKSHAFDAVACICFVRYNVPEVVKVPLRYIRIVLSYFLFSLSFFFLLDRHSTCAPVISRLPSTGHRTPRKHRLETASLFPFYSKEIPMAHDDTRTYTHKVRRNYQTLLVNLFSRLRHCRACQSNVRYPFCQQRSSISPYLYDFQKQSR